MDRRPFLTRQQSREIDRIAIHNYCMHGLVLMENAGRGCVDLLEQLGIAGPISILCGKGNNGGDGFVMARHLAIRGHEVQVLLVPPAAELTGDAQANYEILHRAGLRIVHLAAEGGPAALPDALDYASHRCDWLVDCLLGTGATGSPRPPYDSIIEWMNAEPAKRLAIDVPSGLDCDTGRPSPTTVQATATATFVTSKIGYQQPTALPYLGEVHVIDIGIPPIILQQVADQPSEQ
ncbi:NAD(P)H-hydrate epimerase [Aeoliella mucimassa]|uniref:NAD(P)H-hydrate epimerase n=1 Tax=Aeoliella mucimassa TaxID=2527972 RepID=A0A518AHZ8_9BACT|nr:NAD(P)H-hydrate epimerase [Aeoliella mucimassa]QDU54352.1 Bifunctional NAD(P)H-hydrate repair enzyme Nnr [Aeoliella mucimassa]